MNISRLFSIVLSRNISEQFSMNGKYSTGFHVRTIFTILLFVNTVCVLIYYYIILLILIAACFTLSDIIRHCTCTSNLLSVSLTLATVYIWTWCMLSVIYTSVQCVCTRLSHNIKTLKMVKGEVALFLIR